MIEVNKKQFNSIDDALDYFEVTIKRATNLFMYGHAEIEDCRQFLRMRVYNFYCDKDKIVNSSYIQKRIKWDTLNFLKRDPGFNFFSKHINMDYINEDDLDMILRKKFSSEVGTEERIVLEDLINKTKHKFSNRQYEALVLFLSGAPSDMICKFLGNRSSNLTRYYLLLAEVFTMLREVADEVPAN